MKKLIRLTTALVFTMPMFACTPANPLSGMPIIRVAYSDLDLSGAEGSAILFERITMAAQIVCRPGDRREAALETVGTYKACVNRTVAAAIAKVDRPALTAYAERRSKPLLERVRLALR